MARAARRRDRAWPRLRRVVAVVAALAVAGLGPGAAGERARAGARSGDASRAIAAYRAMQRVFAVPGTHLYRGAVPAPHRQPFSQLWPFSQALAATVALAAIPTVGRQYAADVDDRLAGLARYWNGRSTPPGYDPVTPAGSQGPQAKYYDDNEWVALELLKLHRLTGSAARLRRAEALFDLVVGGWDGEPGHACPGGVFWTQNAYNHDRNTISNAPAAQIGLRVGRVTGNRAAEGWARRMYGWVERCLRGPDGLYLDHVGLDGTRDETRWTYNQGMMVGADVQLFRLTGNRAFLGHARAISDRALAAVQRDRALREPPFFVAIFFENLLELEAVDGGSRFRAAAQAYADRAWATRQVRPGLFRFQPGPLRLLEQAAMVRLYAMLAWGPHGVLLS